MVAGCGLAASPGRGEVLSTENGSFTVVGSAENGTSILLTAGKRDFKGWLSSKDPRDLSAQLPLHVRFTGDSDGRASFGGTLQHRGSPFIIVDGCEFTFDGRLELPSGMGYVWLKNGATFRVGKNAWINNYTGADQHTREIMVRGDPASDKPEVFEIAPGFTADKCGFDPEAGEHGWEPKGFCQLTIINAELRTHSTQSIPSMWKKYKGRLVADAELNFLGKTTWTVDSEHQVYRGTARSWRDLTIVTHKDLTVMANEQIPNSRFGDRNITKRGRGVLDVSCRQFYYRGPPHTKEDSGIPVLRVEEGTLLLRTNPYEFEAGEGGATCVAPGIEVAKGGRIEFWDPGSTVASARVGGRLGFRRHGRLNVAADCGFEQTSVLTLRLSRRLRKQGTAMIVIGGDLTLGGTLQLEFDGNPEPGTYHLFRAEGATSGRFADIQAPTGFTATFADGAVTIATE
jgi:hypothetical protein